MKEEPQQPLESAPSTASTSADGSESKKKVPGTRFTKNPQYYGTGKLPCPDLGPDWQFEQIVRQQGKSAGQFDTYYYSPVGVRLRSKLKLQQHVSMDLANFVFNAGKFKTDVDPTQVAKPKKELSLRQNQLKTQPRQQGRSRKIKREIAISSLIRRGKKRRAIMLKKKKKRAKVSFEKSTSSQRESVSTFTSSEDPRKVDDRMEVSVESPFELFKKEALPHATDLLNSGSQAEDLVLCAWTFLSLDSKREFEQKAASLGYKPEMQIDVKQEPVEQTEEETLMKVPRCSLQPRGLKYKAKHKAPKIVLKRRLQYRNRKLPIPKRRRCGMCSGCLSQNCGFCVHCRDMKKFGGRGSKKQSCIQRRCEAIHRGHMLPDSPDFHMNDPFNISKQLFPSGSLSTFQVDRPTLCAIPSNPLMWQTALSDQNITNVSFSDSSLESLSHSDVPFVQIGGVKEENMNYSYSDNSNGNISENHEKDTTHGSSSLLDESIDNDTNISMEMDPNAFPIQKPHKRKSRTPMCIKPFSIAEIESAIDDDIHEMNLF